MSIINPYEVELTFRIVLSLTALTSMFASIKLKNNETWLR